MDRTADRIKIAGDFARQAIGNLQSSAEFLARAAAEAPELGERLVGVEQQLWAMADVARGVEASIAEVHAELRAAK